MDDGTLLVNIAHSIRMMIPLGVNTKCHAANCKTLISHLRVLKLLFDDLLQTKFVLPEVTVSALEILQRTLHEVKRILETCVKGSKIYSILRSHQTAAQFQDLNIEIENALNASSLISLRLSKHSPALIERCLREMMNAKYLVDKFDDQIREEIENLLVEQREGRKASFDKLQKLATLMGISTKEEIAKELSALEKARYVAGLEKDKMEEDFIDQVISLFMQLAEDEFDEGQGKGEIQGVQIPADLRCPLSLELMADPVIVASGQTYERAYIQHWLDQGNTRCPKTGQPLAHANLIPNYTVKALIANWCQTNNVPLPKVGTLKTKDWSYLPQPPSAAFEDIENTQAIQHTEAAMKNEDDLPDETSGNTVILPVNEIQEPEDDILKKKKTKTTLHEEEVTTTVAAANEFDLKLVKVKNGSHSPPPPPPPQVKSTTTCDYSGELSGELVGLSSRNSPDRTPTTKDIPISNNFHERRRSPVRSVYLGSDRSVEVVVERLVEELQSSDVDVQRNAAAEVRLMAKISPEDRIRIASAGAIKHLVKLLSSSDPKTQENAVTAILNLSLNDNNKAEIAEAGAIVPLVQVLRSGTTNAMENAAATLYSLSVKDEYKETIGVCGGIPPLVELLRTGMPRGKKDAATALFNVSLFQENKLRIVQAGAVRPLIDLICEPRMGMVDKAVAVLSNLSTINEGKFAIGDEGGIGPLVEVVEAGSLKAKEGAAAALLQLCSCSHKFRSIALQEGAVPPLHLLSQTGTPRAKEKAVAILGLFREQRHGRLGGGTRHLK